ncbi:hypothetical protein [Amycolatopsis anabasis]|uniref:hypothetical protein n=1 Tax=Amycolatopsis anabasis TaxID=1840409 RepID=UPI00131B0620|nr:hypothetical protein [Amycolatopsis anabasis]
MTVRLLGAGWREISPGPPGPDRYEDPDPGYARPRGSRRNWLAETDTGSGARAPKAVRTDRRLIALTDFLEASTRITVEAAAPPR